MKRFRSKRYGFEISVPDDWICRPSGFWNRLLGRDKVLFGQVGQLVAMNIYIGPLSPEPSLEETASAFKAFAQHHGYEIDTIGTIEVGGKSHFVASYYAYPLKRVLVKYLLVFNEMEYAITCNIGSTDEMWSPQAEAMFDNRKALYDKIVKTFRLIR